MMHLDTALAVLHTAGIPTTPISRTHWNVHLGYGPEVAATCVNDAALAALVGHYQKTFPAKTNPTLTLAQTTAMLRATGVTVEPMDGFFWQVIFCENEVRTCSRMINEAQLVQLGNRVAQLVPVVLGNMPAPGMPSDAQPLDERTLVKTLAHLGSASTKQLAQLHQASEAQIAQVVAGLAKTGFIREMLQHWFLIGEGWEQAAQMVALEDIWRDGKPAVGEDLALAMGQLSHDLHAMQFAQMELVYDRTEHHNAVQFTIAPQSGSVVWCHDLAACSAAAGLPSLTLLVILLEADVGKSTELPAFLTGLRHEVQTTGCFPCIITPNEGLAKVVATELARYLPHEPWAVSSLTQMLESQWMSHCSGQLTVDLALALRGERK